MSRFRSLSDLPPEVLPDLVLPEGITFPLLYVVLYRVGNVSRFEWQRTEAMTSTEVVLAHKAIEQLGYPCSIESFWSSLAIGLPTAFDPEFPNITEWH